MMIFAKKKSATSCFDHISCFNFIKSNNIRDFRDAVDKFSPNQFLMVVIHFRRSIFVIASLKMSGFRNSDLSSSKIP